MNGAGRSHERLYWWIGATALVMIIPATLVPAALSQRQRQVAAYAEWRLSGPACEQLTTVVDPARFPKTLVIDGAAFSFEHGDIACATLHADGGQSSRTFPACQFVSPGRIRVSAPGGAYTFDPGPGRPATVHLMDGRPRCVTAASPDLFRTSKDRPYQR